MICNGMTQPCAIRTVEQIASFLYGIEFSRGNLLQRYELVPNILLAASMGGHPPIDDCRELIPSILREERQ
jgi:hypothetical protein